MDYKADVHQTIKTFDMIRPDESVLVAVSGGADSLGLLHVLKELAPVLKITVAAAHVNHCLRGANADRDEAFTLNAAQEAGIPCYTTKIDVKALKQGRSIEEAAREERYQYLTSLAKRRGFDKIALGHHADDNAELLILNLLRGAGGLGLSGIPPYRDGLYIRPQIRVFKKDILAYLKERGIKFVIDETNDDVAILRNRVRHEVIPFLEEHMNPGISRNLNRIADIFRHEEDYWDQIITPIFLKMVMEKDEESLWMGIEPFCALHKAVQRRVLRKAVFHVKHNLRRISFGHIDNVLCFISEGPVSGRIDLPDGVHVIKDGGRFGVCNASYGGLFNNKAKGRAKAPGDSQGAEHPVFCYTINSPGVLRIPEVGKILKLTYISTDSLEGEEFKNPKTAFMDADAVRFPLTVRNIQKGDRFTPLGMKGRQKIARFFINRKVPRLERVKCPVVLSENEIIWVGGYGAADGVKIKADTKNVVKFELYLA